MSHKLQITVDDKLNKQVRASAKKMGLSVSSYARLVLLSVVPSQQNKWLDQSIKDVNANHVESFTLTAFNRQIDRL